MTPTPTQTANPVAFVQSHTNAQTPTPTPPRSPTPTGPTSRGYDTTPAELQAIARKANSGIQPYKDAVLSVEHFANSGSDSVAASSADPTYWPYGTITGNQDCPHGKV